MTMKKCSLRLSLVLLGLLIGFAVPAQAEVVYDSFPGDIYGTTGYFLSGPDFGNASLGFTFSLNGNYYIDSVTLPVGFADNGFTLAVQEYVSGENPGSILGVFEFNLADYSFPQVITSSSSTRPLLAANTPYWLVLTAEGLDLRWLASASGHNPGEVFQHDDFYMETSITDVDNMGVFRMEGTAAVPLPPSVLLLASGVAGIAVVRRRLRRQ